MSHQIELGYVRIEVPDPAALTSFFTDVVGLEAGDEAPDGARTWSNDEAVHRILVAEGARNDLTAIGIEAVDHAAFADVLDRLAASGFAAREGDASTTAARRVSRLATIDAPWGSSLELVLGLERRATAATPPLMPGGFLTVGQGFGHVVVATTDLEEATRFVVDGLGMTQSDWIEQELAPGFRLEVRFFHCNARHHTLAIAGAPFALPQHLHHLMVETVDRDDVGRAFDRAHASGLPLPNGLGVHDNDRMFSFYVQSPAGFQVEVGHGAVQIEAPWTGNRRYDRISAWGHQLVERGA